jgi:hypothetical protein
MCESEDVKMNIVRFFGVAEERIAVIALFMTDKTGRPVMVGLGAAPPSAKKACFSGLSDKTRPTFPDPALMQNA